MWLAVSALLACLCLAPVPVEAQRVIAAAVVQIVDGNTLMAKTKDDARLPIRLLGIDAPEVVRGKNPGQPLGKEARDYLDRQIGRKGVRLQAYGQDRYGRTLGVIWLGEINVNVLMVMMGYAEVYRAAPCQYYCAELLEGEAWARQQRLGVWAQGTSHESPAEFRRRLKISED
jgi:micrococcal nuclease